jgi:hypothetical protein
MTSRTDTMKKLHLATVVTNTQIYAGGDDVRRTRVIPVYAEEYHEAYRLVQETLETSNGCGDRTSVLSIDIEEPIGSPD